MNLEDCIIGDLSVGRQLISWESPELEILSMEQTEITNDFDSFELGS